MPDHAPEIASAFRPLRRALIARRLQRLDPVLRLELAAKLELRELAAGGCAVVFASHAVETVERLCDRAVTLHLGHVVRTLARAERGGPEHGPSPLEREFLSATQGLHAPEAPA